MFHHSYCNLKYGILHRLQYVCRNGHIVQDSLSTIFYNDIVWC